MAYPKKSEIQFKLQHTFKRLFAWLYANTGLLFSLSSVFTLSQIKLFVSPNQTVSPNAEAFTELQHIPSALPRPPHSPQFTCLDPRLQQPPYLWCYSAEGLWALTTFCRAQKLLKPSMPLLPASQSLPAGKPWDQAAVGRQQSAGQAGGRELETDLIKGRRPGGDQREGDTHLNNSGANKSFRLGSVQDVKQSWISMYFRLPSMQNAVLLNNPTLTNQHYFKSIPHKVNEESGYAWFCGFIALALGWNSTMWRFWELQVWPLQVGCWNRYSIFWSQIVHRTFRNWRKVMDQMMLHNIRLASLHL